MVSEIVSECVDYGIVTQLQLHVVLDRIHSRYLAPKRSLLQIMRTAGHRSGQFRYKPHTVLRFLMNLWILSTEHIHCE